MGLLHLILGVWQASDGDSSGAIGMAELKALTLTQSVTLTLTPSNMRNCFPKPNPIQPRVTPTLFEENIGSVLLQIRR